MKLDDIINYAFYGYMEDMYPSNGFESHKEVLKHPHVDGDCLAEFLYKEIKDTFDADATEAAQIQEAERALDVAIGQLQSAKDAIRWVPKYGITSEN